MGLWNQGAATFNATTAGIRRELLNRMANFPAWWMAHCTRLQSTTKTENFAWAGALPQPREFINGREFKGLREFTQNIENKKFELSFKIDEDFLEDNQTDHIQIRIGEAAGAWESFKLFQFTTLLTSGGTDLAYDGNTFFHDSRTEGDSGTIDNQISTAAATGTRPTAEEYVTGFEDVRSQFMLFKDDQNLPINAVAAMETRAIIPPILEGAALKAATSMLINNTDNPWKGKFSIDVNPYLSAADVEYWSLTGADKRPYLYQERRPARIVIDDRPETREKENGILVMMSGRWRFGYGEFRRGIKHTWT